ncbi:hypothetical protein B0G57_12110 [Trinickia symbiotica]|nr:hypothetical protein B0G57_12110 [Trinickia symbiotica]
MSSVALCTLLPEQVAGNNNDYPRVDEAVHRKAWLR